MNLKEQAVSLYLSGFPEDTKQFAEDFINRFFDNNCTYIAEQNRLISMLFMFDCAIKQRNETLPAFYVYAVVTDPAFRGSGYMRKLMNKAKKEAENKGKEALIIKPSNEGLYGFYEKLGFKTVFYFSEQNYERKENSNLELYFTNAQYYHKKREELLADTPHIIWEEMLEYIGENGRFFVGEDFCGLVEEENERAFLREFLGKKEGIDALLSKLSYKTAVVRTNDKEKPFGMLCPLKEIVTDKMYMGFAMD